MKHIVKKWFREFFSYIFPPSLEEIQILSQPQKLRENFPLSQKPPFSFINAVLSYRHSEVRTLIHSLKYHGNPTAAQSCATLLYEEILTVLSDELLLSQRINPVLIPIPLSKKRQRERGFNQSGILVKYIQALDPEIASLCLDCLEKSKETPSQTEMPTKADRKRNVKNCFKVSDPALIHGKTALLVDDVTTTGSTLNEARKVLQTAGAKNVFAFAVAH